MILKSTAKLEKLKAEKSKLDAELSSPNAFNDPRISEKTKRSAELAAIIDCMESINSAESEKVEAEEMLGSKDKELSDLAKVEIDSLITKIESLKKELRSLLVPKDPNDDKNIILEIRAGAGGDEAGLFASELMRMYVKWCENQNFKVTAISVNTSDSGGIKDASLEVKGRGAYGKMKYEAGVHRVQRIPVTESSGRIHTSTATMVVMPEAKEADINIQPNDLRIDSFRASGNGGQSVNTTDSAVRITYLPTGLIVTCQDEKSQLKNKDKAMRVLRSRLLQIEIEKRQAKLSAKRKDLVGSGDRSEKIRTYNFPQDRVTDHRIGYSQGNIAGFMEGDLDEIMHKLKEAEVELLENE